MSRYDYYSQYPKYVTVAERKLKAAKIAAKTPGDLRPIVISGRKISSTFWGKAWCDNVESYQDYANRLPRGRSYVRNGSVIDLKIAKGSVTALVCGTRSTPYKITITIKQLNRPRWDALKKQCLGKIDSLVSLVQGKLSQDTLALLCEPDTGLFPEPSEITMKCSCPDWAGLCKHLAAALYGIGARLDTDPKLFFKLRGIDENELINADVVDALTDGISSEIDDAAISDIFGVDFDTSDTLAVADPAPKPKTKPAAKAAPKRTPPVDAASAPRQSKPRTAKPKTKPKQSKTTPSRPAATKHTTKPRSKQ